MAQEKKHSMAGQRFGALKKYMKANESSAGQLAGKVTEAGQKDLQTSIQKRQEKQDEAFGSSYTPTSQEGRETKTGGIFASEKQSLTDKDADIGKVFKGTDNTFDYDGYKDSKFVGDEGADIYKEYGETQSKGYAYDPYRQQKAEQQAKQIGTESGRFSLLKQRFNRNEKQPEYSRGQQRLDQLLLQTQGDKLKDVQKHLASGTAVERQAKQDFGSDVVSSFGGVKNEDGQLINVTGQLGDQAALLRKRIADINVGGRTTGLENEYSRLLNGDVNDPEFIGASQKAQTARSDLQTAIKNKILTPDQAKLLGIEKSDKYGYQTYNVDDQSLKTYTPEYGDILTDEQKAKYEALSSLAGVNPDARVDVRKTSEVALDDIGSDYATKWKTAKQNFDKEIAPTETKLAQRNNIITDKPVWDKLTKQLADSYKTVAGEDGKYRQRKDYTKWNDAHWAMSNAVKAALPKYGLTETQLANMMGIGFSNTPGQDIWHLFSPSSRQIPSVVSFLQNYAKSAEFSNINKERQAILDKHGVTQNLGMEKGVTLTPEQQAKAQEQFGTNQKILGGVYS